MIVHCTMLECRWAHSLHDEHPHPPARPLPRRKELVRRRSETAALVGFYRHLIVSDGVDALAGLQGHNGQTISSIGTDMAMTTISSGSPSFQKSPKRKPPGPRINVLF